MKKHTQQANGILSCIHLKEGYLRVTQQLKHSSSKDTYYIVKASYSVQFWHTLNVIMRSGIFVTPPQAETACSHVQSYNLYYIVITEICLENKLTEVLTRITQGSIPSSRTCTRSINMVTSCLVLTLACGGARGTKCSSRTFCSERNRGKRVPIIHGTV